MNFATMPLLEQIKASKIEAQHKNIFYRFIFNIVYRYQSRNCVKTVDKYLKNSSIDSNHMMDIIHTLNVFCSANIITEEERRQIFQFRISEFDGTSIIEYDQQVPDNVSRYEQINTGRIAVKITDDAMQITDIVINKERNESSIYATRFLDNKNHDFYNTVGRAFIFGIKKYLDIQPRNKYN